MAQTKEFMLVFRYEAAADYQPSEAELQQMHQQWGAFIGQIAIQEKLVSTHQLGMEGMQVFADQSVSEGVYVSEKQTLGGNLILKAASIREAVEIAKGCPILHMGGAVEVRAIQPM